MKNSQTIYGIYLGTSTLKGKSVRTKPKVVVKDYIEVPRELKLRNEDVDLCADVMYIQQVPFLITISKRIKFITILPIASRSHKLLCEAFDQTFRVYNVYGFRIKSLHVDLEFETSHEVMDNEDNDIAIE